MDGDLDASRPNWVGSNAPIHGAGGSTSFTLDATRPQWASPNTVISADASSTVHQQVQNDQERVVEDVVQRSSRPIDFLKLVGLMETVSSAEDQIKNTLIVDMPLSLLAVPKVLGRGLSFEVLLVRVGKQPKEHMNLSSEFVVYKKLRGLTDKLDVIEKGELLRAALLEVRILTHQPIKNHPNIIDFIQLIWEPDADLLDHAWPVIVLEYAGNGTLADFQEDHPGISFSLKRQLCRDVGHGLLVLHACDIIHGDLKSENVLICNDPSGGVVAKLADFGCAIADLEASETLKLPAFTMPWNAPECHDKLPRGLLKYTDVYSYGLLVWRVAVNGANPFRLIHALSSLDKPTLHREVEMIKKQDRLLALAQSTLLPPFCNADVNIPLVREVLGLTLRLDATTRDLHGAVARLSEQIQELQYPREPLMPYEYETVNLVLPSSAMTPMCLLSSIIRELVALSARSDDIGNRACSQLFQIYLTRSEWPGAKDNAARWLVNTVKRQESPRIAIYMRGIFEYLGERPPSIDITRTLQVYAADGCMAALTELKHVSPSTFSYIQKHFRRRGGLMSRDQTRAISIQIDLDNLDGYLNNILLSQQGVDVNGLFVSESKDLLIHAAARVGSVGVADRLLRAGVDIDAVNGLGETALFQACRAGNFDMVKFLLHRGANTTLAAKNGETPLHWIAVFDEDEIEPATELLFSHDAMPCLYSDVNPGTSSATDYENVYGTPLHYALLIRSEKAAEALLIRGADPFFGYEYEGQGSLPPYLIAICELLPNIVKRMLGPSTDMNDLKRYLQARKEPVLMTLIRLSSTRKMIYWATLGQSFIHSLIETIDIIRTFEGKQHISGNPAFKISLLHAAITYGQPTEIIEHLLKTGCDEDLELTSDLRGHTPLQAAIYLNRRDTFLLLLKHGANIHRALLVPEGISYLQYCSTVGSEGEYFAKELVARGAQHKAVAMVIDKHLTATSSPPALTAIYAGNFPLATWFSKLQPIPAETPVLSVLLASPRLPVSRLRYLLEPPAGTQPSDLNDNKDVNRNCFHALATCRGGTELESIVNFRYLLQQCKARGEEHLINQLDTKGLTPLNGAAVLGRLEIVRELLSAGADPNLGIATCANAARFGLGRLRRAPSQVLDYQEGVTLTTKDARRLEEDFNAIIVLSRQYGSEEPTMMGNIPKMDVRKLFGSDAKGALNFAKDTLQKSYSRYQSEAVFRSRFSNDAGQPTTSAPQGSSSNGASVGREKSFREKFKEGRGYAKWLFKPVQAIDERRVSKNYNQPAQAPGPQQSHSQVTPVAIPPISPPAVAPSRMPIVTSPVSPSQPPQRAPLTPVPHAGPQNRQSIIAPHAYNYQKPYQQMRPKAQPSQYHVQLLSGQISQIFSQRHPDPATLHRNIQACLDGYFLHAGPNILSLESDTSAGAPLGSLSVLELENGISKTIRGHFSARVLLRDGWVKVLICPPGAPTAEQAFLRDGWAGWRQLEEREAEILAAQFEAKINL